MFKEFAGVDAFPMCLDTKDPDKIVETVTYLAPAFGGINLEDISAPRCFEIEDRLKPPLDIPVFHDDQHGTAVVTLAALMNAANLTGKELNDLSVLIVGLGAAGIAAAKILQRAGVHRIIGCDSPGPSTPTAPTTRTEACRRSSAGSRSTRTPKRPESPADVIDGADLFVGLSGRA